MKPLLTEDELREGVGRLADDIGRHYGHRPLTIVAVLTGSVVLLADLIRRLDMPLRIGLVQARSYRGPTTLPGSLVLNLDMLPNLRGRDVLILDDIFDTGRTLLELINELDQLGPATVRSAVLLRKKGRQVVDIEPDHVAFEIPDEFVVGYGLDYNDAHRHLPYLAVLEASDLRPVAKSDGTTL